MTGTDDDQTPEMPDEPEMSDDLEMSDESEQPSDADGIGIEGETEDPHLNMQCAILDAALPHAAFDGWTRDVLVQAAFDVELSDADVDLAFPRGPVDAVLLHARLADEDMTEEMATLDLEEMRTRDKVAIAIRVRLEAQIANREAIRRGLRLLAAPRPRTRRQRTIPQPRHTNDPLARLSPPPRRRLQLPLPTLLRSRQRAREILDREASEGWRAQSSTRRCLPAPRLQVRAGVPRRRAPRCVARG